MSEPAVDVVTAAREARQEIALARRVRSDFYRRSTFNRGRIDRSSCRARGPKTLDDLVKLAPVQINDFRTIASSLTLGRPSRSRKHGPAVWLASQGEVFAYSKRDLGLLAALGSEVLIRAGVGDGDVIFDVSTQCSSRDRMQLQTGATRAGVIVVEHNIDSVNELQSCLRNIDPSVIAGSPVEVHRVLGQVIASGGESRLHTAIVIGSPYPDDELTALAEGAGIALVKMWSPPGVFAAWSECRNGTGFHTFPDDEIIEIVDGVSSRPVTDRNNGQVLWTGTHWYATAMLRLDTGAFGALDGSRCENCRRLSPRLVPTAHRTSFCDVLANNPDITAWAAELHRTFKGDELVIWVAVDGSSLNVLAAIEQRIGPARVQVVDEAEIAAIVEAANGERFGDRRAFVTGL